MGPILQKMRCYGCETTCTFPDSTSVVALGSCLRLRQKLFRAISDALPEALLRDQSGTWNLQARKLQLLNGIGVVASLFRVSCRARMLLGVSLHRNREGNWGRGLTHLGIYPRASLTLATQHGLCATLQL